MLEKVAVGDDDNDNTTAIGTGETRTIWGILIKKKRTKNDAAEDERKCQ